MINWIKSNKSSIIRVMFIIPIILVAAISISHVVSWYNISNPLSWAIFLSIAVEIAAMTALSAASVKVKGFSVWAVFCIVTFIQFMGNIFFSYKEIDVNDPNFKNWMELVSPVYDMMGIDSSDTSSHKRWLSLLTGGLLPLISLTCLHFFVKYGDMDDEVKEVENKLNVKEEKKVINKIDDIEDVKVRLSKIKESIQKKEEEKIEENVIVEEIIDGKNDLEVEFTENGEEKKNYPTESDNYGGGFVDEGSINNSKIQLGSTKPGENIIYKK